MKNFEYRINGQVIRVKVDDRRGTIADVLVDGAFVEALKDITLRFRGSSNQRLIDMKKTRQRGEIVLWAEHGADEE